MDFAAFPKSSIIEVGAVSSFVTFPPRFETHSFLIFLDHILCNSFNLEVDLKIQALLSQQVTQLFP